MWADVSNFYDIITSIYFKSYVNFSFVSQRFLMVFKLVKYVHIWKKSYAK